MTKLWKISMLALLLAIPAMAYIFLQLFGENQYDLPIYHENGVNNGLADCNFSTSQHYIDFQSFSELNVLGQDEILVFGFLSSNCEDTCQIKFNQLSRIVNFFSNEPVIKVVSMVYDNESNPILKQQFMSGENTNWIFINEGTGQLETFVTCGLVMPYDPKSLHQFVLVDKERRIRGYYYGLDITDVDRLITEIRILLNNYKIQAYEQNHS